MSPQGMDPVKLFYCDEFVLPLPADHRFPMRKYALLRQRLLDEGFDAAHQFAAPPAATREQLLRAHSAEYVDRAERGEFSEVELRALGFPWSPQLIERSKRSSGGTTEAARAALREGVSVNLAGGTHHAFRERPMGYCVFNDSVVAARAMQQEAGVGRVVVLDCDVHQGDGTASIAAGDETLFTFSIHGARNYPFHKEESDLDVALPDGADDAVYLPALAAGVKEALARSRAELAIYLAGADPFEGDRYGRMKLTKSGLAQRDRIVFDLCRRAGLPVAVSMAGGYARDVEDVVDIHAATVRIAAEFGL